MYGRITPKYRTTGPVDRRELGGQRLLVRLAGQVLEGAVRDHVHALAAAEQLGAVAGVHDHGVHPVGQPDVHRLAPDHVVHREHARARGRQQVRVDPLDR